MKGFLLKFSRKQNDDYRTINKENIVEKNINLINFIKKENQILIFDEKFSEKINSFNACNIFVGDVIDGDLEKPLYKENNIVNGFYYKIELNINSIQIFSSYFNILPIYYAISNTHFYISSDINLISKVFDNNLTLNKQYLLQQNLFNYSIDSSSIYSQIKIVPANSYLTIENNKLEINKHTNIEEYFVNNPISLNDSLEDLKELFLNRVQKYFPKESFAISFTSGFDGRTLVACAKYFNQNFGTYSFGSFNNPDLYLPLEQAKLLSLNFTEILLDDEYSKNQYLKIGKEYIELYGASTNLLQVHMLHSAKIIGKNYNYVLNGMFGSELFRAMHIPGQLTSKTCVDFFFNIESDNWRNSIINSENLMFINKSSFNNEIEELLFYLEVFRNRILSLTPNQRFYIFIFEIAFPRLFGQQWILPQLPHIIQRSPYLDFMFIKKILTSKFAGVNNKFFTHNPFKRFKGQLFYSSLINDINQEISQLITGKGYKPNDLLSLSGKLKITTNFLKKKIVEKSIPKDLNNLGLLSGYYNHFNYLDSILISNELYNTDFITSIKKELYNGKNKHRDKLLETISTNYYIQKNF